MKVEMNTYSYRPKFGMAVKATDPALCRIIETMKDEKDWRLFNRLVAAQESNPKDVILTLEDEPNKLGQRIIASVGKRQFVEGENFFGSSIIDTIKKAVGLADELRNKSLDQEMEYSKFVAVKKVGKIGKVKGE